MHSFPQSPWVPYHTQHMLHPSCSRRPTAAELIRQTSGSGDSRKSLVTLFFLLTFYPSIISVLLHIICWFIHDFPLIVVPSYHSVLTFLTFLHLLSCKWLKNLSGIIVMDLSIQRMLKLRTVFQHMLHSTLAATIFCMQEFTFGSAFLPSYTYISYTCAHTHKHLFSILQSIV